MEKKSTDSYQMGKITSKILYETKNYFVKIT